MAAMPAVTERTRGVPAASASTATSASTRRMSVASVPDGRSISTRRAVPPSPSTRPWTTPENAAILTVDWLRPVFRALAGALEPEWITINPFGTLGRIEARDGRVRWPYGGWMVYLKPDWAVRVTAPADCVVEPQPDGGALLIAVQDGPFAFDNPAHADAFEALRRSLAPLWPDLEGRTSRPANQGSSGPAGARTGTA